MIFALFPPSSNVAGINFSAAAFAIFFPISVEPVKASLQRSGCSNKYCPDLLPEPVTRFKTPAGSRSWISSVKTSILSDVVEDGLNTTQLPAASAGASFHAAIRNGKFQGTI